MSPTARRSSDTLFIGVLIVAVLAWLGWATRSQPAAREGAFDARVGTSAASFALPRLDGETRRLEDYRDDAVLIDFWATTCEPCRRSMPIIESLDEELRDQGLTVISLNVDVPDPGRHAIVEAFARDQRIRADVLLDNGNTAYAYDATRIPLVFVLDRGLVIRHVFRGFTRRSDLSRAIEDTIAASRAAP